MRGRPWAWITGRPRLTDGLVVGFNLLEGTGAVVGAHFGGPIPLPALLLVVLESLPLWYRRRQPVLVLGIIVCVEIVKWSLHYSNDPAGPSLVFAVYAVSVYDRGRARLWVAGAAIAIIGVAVGLLLLGDFQVSRDLIPAGATALVAWVIGDYMRSRRQFFSDLVARHQKEREDAAEEERLRIARELHDVVAHNVSAMAIQAGAARVSGSSSEEALKSIEEGARSTLSELNRLLGVLRKSPTASAVPGARLAPQPTLDEAEALLKPARDAGVEASLKATGEKRPLPTAIDLSAYRIIQEAITNVLKHANASRLEVVVDYQPEALVVAISDNGSGPSEALGTSSGHGLIGMRERVELFGGELTTGSSSLGGFVVRAKLPLRS